MTKPKEIEIFFLKAYEEYSDAIFRYSYYKTSNKELARDLTQETFMRSLDYLNQGKEIKSIRPFLYKTASNLIIDWYKKKKDKSVSLEELQEEGSQVKETSSRTPLLNAETSEVITVIKKMDESYRDAILMRYLGDLKLKEIAEIMGEKENVISVRIHRGLKKLRELLNQ